MRSGRPEVNLANSFVVFATRECVAVRFAWLWLSLPGAGKMLYLPPSRGQVARSRMQRSVRSLRWIELHLCREFLTGRKSSLPRWSGSSAQGDVLGPRERPIASMISCPPMEP